jgi:hypothetical protein
MQTQALSAGGGCHVDDLDQRIHRRGSDREGPTGLFGAKDDSALYLRVAEQQRASVQHEGRRDLIRAVSTWIGLAWLGHAQMRVTIRLTYHAPTSR